MMMLRRRLLDLAAPAALLLTLSLVPALAFGYGDGTPDTDPPAEEQVCNGYGGRAWGLCVAYCEAQDCPASEHPSCDVLRNKLFDLVGSEIFPCDGSGNGGIG
jgi:hypothetical protein